MVPERACKDTKDISGTYWIDEFLDSILLFDSRATLKGTIDL
jgi:hypothetical protein